MININEYYLHSIIGSRKYSIKKFKSILGDQAILSRAIQKDRHASHGFSRKNEICLTDPLAPKVTGAESALDMFVSSSLSFMVDRDIEIHKPKVVPTEQLNEDMIKSGFVTNLYDEVRTNGIIDFDKVKGIIIPISSMYSSDLDYLLFSNYFFNLLVSLGVSDFSLSSYVSFHQDKLKVARKRKVMNQFTDQVIKLETKYGIDIPIYDYDRIDKKVKRLVL